MGPLLAVIGGSSATAEELAAAETVAWLLADHPDTLSWTDFSVASQGRL